jgi:hypothetical protein
MKLTIDEIKERVENVEGKQSEYRKAARVWEDMWNMKVFDRTPKDAIEQDGQEQVTLPVAYNVVHLAQRLIASDPRIEVPSEAAEEDDDQAAQRRQRWLAALWQRTNRQQGRDVIGDAVWQALVRGRFCFQVLWVRDQLPERMRDRRLPVLIRVLDPLNVGIKQGPLYVEYAYHKDRQTADSLAQMYPDLEIKKASRKGKRAGLRGEDKVDVIDLWYVDHKDGTVWNAVVVEEQFAKEPVQTDYPEIPIVCGMGDTAPIESDLGQGLSILHPLKDLYPYMCRLASQIGTGLLAYFWPLITVESELGQEVGDLDLRPGATQPLPAGTKINMLRADVNVPLANNMLSILDTHVQMATFPGVMYGESGNMQAGYGVNVLADQARGRIAQFRNNVESALEHVNEIVLGLVDALADSDGVQIWGKDDKSGAIYKEVLTPADINGAYNNMVTLVPGVTLDDLQKETLGLRMVEQGIASMRTYREKFIREEFPDDEALRVAYEALITGELGPKTQAEALIKYRPKDWRAMVSGTPLEQIAMGLEGETGRQAPPGGPPGMGPGMPPGGPPGMGPGMPPGGPPGGPPGMQAPGMLGPGGPPPVMQGQMTPETLLGMPGQAAPPGLFQELVGEELPPEELLRRMGGAGRPPMR